MAGSSGAPGPPGRPGSSCLAGAPSCAYYEIWDLAQHERIDWTYIQIGKQLAEIVSMNGNSSSTELRYILRAWEESLIYGSVCASLYCLAYR